LNLRHANEHRHHREPLLEITETLLREFFRPYNELLAKLIRITKTNPNPYDKEKGADPFLWLYPDGESYRNKISREEQEDHSMAR
jgi:hypothetical protein